MTATTKRWLTKWELIAVTGLDEHMYQKLRKMGIFKPQSPGPGVRGKYDAQELAKVPGLNLDWSKLETAGEIFAAYYNRQPTRAGLS